MQLAAKAPHPNAARLFYDFVLSKEGQEMLRGFQRIPVRKDVEPDPPRLFRGFKIARRRSGRLSRFRRYGETVFGDF